MGVLGMFKLVLILLATTARMPSMTGLMLVQTLEITDDDEHYNDDDVDNDGETNDNST
jgi:hypothetical protein